MIPHTIYVQGSYNDIHDCENVYLNCEKGEVHLDKSPRLIREEPTQTTPAGLPEELCTEQACVLLEKLCRAGILDKDWQSVTLSNAERGALIEFVADELGIRHKWKLFGNLWNIDSETLRTSNARGLDQGKTWKFRQRLNDL